MKTALVVDDSPSIRQLVAHTLKQAGFNVLEGSNGSEGLDRMGQGAIDLIITDLNMPDASGLDVARAVRAVRADLPVVLVSGYVRPGDDDLRRAGVVARLDKPFTAETLTEALARLRRRKT